jgi:carbon monoxide dehydrogenase subunit G
MASIHREIEIDRNPAAVWDAIRDVGMIHRRLVPGFVVDCRLEDGGTARVVTFGNGMVVRELIVAVDDQRRRHAWAARSEMLQHYNASVQVFPVGDGTTQCRVVWIADLLPHAAATAVAGMIEQGLTVMKQTMESNAPGR